MYHGGILYFVRKQLWEICTALQFLLYFQTRLLGHYPLLYGQRIKNGRGIMFTLNDLFDIAIKMEENGHAVYLKALKQVNNRDIESLVQWMADEENRHKSWFQEQKDRLSAGSRDLNVMLPGVIQEMMGDKSLSLCELDFSKITTPLQMLETFIMFENDTILFYQFLEAFVESESVKAGLHKIIAEETAHVDKISEMIQSVKAAGEL